MPGSVAAMTRPQHPAMLSGQCQGLRTGLAMSATKRSDYEVGPVRAALVGREPELAVIDRAIRGGRPLLLVGDAGIGKSALLEAGAERARELGHTVLRAAAVEHEAGLPFAGLHQILISLRGETDRLPVGQRDVLLAALERGESAGRTHLLLCNAVLGLLRTAAAHRPVSVTLDDLHWLDRASSEVLAFVVRRLEGAAITFLATLPSRDGGFFERAGIAELELGPLSDVAARRLLAAAFPGLKSQHRSRVLLHARGNPLALLELPRTCPAAPQPSGVRPFESGPMNRRLMAGFAARLATLPAACRENLLLIAMTRQDELELLGDVEGIAGVLVDLEPARTEGLIDVDSGAARVNFRHPLIRAVVLDATSAAELRAAHRRLAIALSADPERRSWHLRHAATGPDETIADALERASVDLRASGDASGAVATMVSAAELSPGHAARIRRLAGAAFLGSYTGADLGQTRELLARVRALEPDPTASLEGAAAAACVLMMGAGDLEPAQRLLVQAIDVTSGQSPSTLARIAASQTLLSLCRLAERPDWWAWRDAQIGRLRAAAPVSVSLSERIEDTPVRDSSVLFDELDRAIAGLTACDDPAEIIGVADAAALTDRLGGCREPLRRLLGSELPVEATMLRFGAQCMLALDAFQTGRWEESEELTRAAVGLAGAHGFGLPERSAVTTVMLCAALRGNHSQARELASEMLRWALPRGVGHVAANARYGLLLSAITEGDFEAAFAHAVLITPPGTLTPHQPRASWVMLDLVESALRTGRELEARAHVAAVQASGLATMSSRTAMLTAAAAALVTPDEGTITSFEAALDVPGGARWPFEHARVQLLFGERLRRLREPSRSRMHLAAACETFERLGALPWAERASQELRATGLTRARSRGAGGPDRDALTPQELEIAQLAAAGLSNKEIGQRLYLSHRTVGAHLYRVFPKLDITSRAALRDALPNAT